jgi:hypothetical protein
VAEANKNRIVGRARGIRQLAHVRRTNTRSLGRHCTTGRNHIAKLEAHSRARLSLRGVSMDEQMEPEPEQDLSDRIRERAYEIWVANGHRDGEAEQHWLAAEREILSTLQSEAVVKAPTKRIRGRTIRPFLARQAFEPDVVRNMSLAFDSARKALGLRTREDPATTRVAQKVIELAQRNIRDVATLRAMTLKEFNREE